MKRAESVNPYKWQLGSEDLNVILISHTHALTSRALFARFRRAVFCASAEVGQPTADLSFLPPVRNRCVTEIVALIGTSTRETAYFVVVNLFLNFSANLHRAICSQRSQLLPAWMKGCCGWLHFKRLYFLSPWARTLPNRGPDQLAVKWSEICPIVFRSSVCLGTFCTEIVWNLWFLSIVISCKWSFKYGHTLPHCKNRRGKFTCGEKVKINEAPARDFFFQPTPLKFKGTAP